MELILNDKEIQESIEMVEWFLHPELPPEDPWNKEAWMIVEADDMAVVLL